MSDFYIGESLVYPTHKSVKMSAEFYERVQGSISGSFTLLFPRIWGLKSSDFLRMVRDLYGATLNGKNGGYITFSFPKEEDAKRFFDETLERWKIITREMEENENNGKNSSP